MPSVSVKTDADAWQRWAVRLANIIWKGPGSNHGRVETLKQAAIAVATENFNAGKAEGAIEAAQSLGANPEGALLLEMQPILLAVVPQKPDGYGAVELAKAAADEITRLKAAPPAEAPVEVTDENLKVYMRLAEQGKVVCGPTGEQLSLAVRTLCMEVAKLRFQLKAKG